MYDVLDVFSHCAQGTIYPYISNLSAVPAAPGIRHSNFSGWFFYYRKRIMDRDYVSGTNYGSGFSQALVDSNRITSQRARSFKYTFKVTRISD